jgi:hypothetical protein
VRGRAVLILTADPRFSVHGLRPGTRFLALFGAGGYRVGANKWWLLNGGAVLKVRGKRVEEVGLADPALIRTRADALRFLTSFSNR